MMMIQSDEAPFPNLGKDAFIHGLDTLCIKAADYLMTDRQGIDGSMDHPSAIAPGTDLAGDDDAALLRMGGFRDRTVRLLQAFLSTGGTRGKAWLENPKDLAEFLKDVNLDPEKVQILSLMLLRLRGRAQLRAAKGGALYDKVLAGLLYPVLSAKDWVSKVLQTALFAFGDVEVKDLDKLLSKRGLNNNTRNCLVLRLVIEVLKRLWIPILELDNAVDLLRILEDTFVLCPPWSLDAFPDMGLNWADPDQVVDPRMRPIRLLEDPLPVDSDEEDTGDSGSEPATR